MFCPRCGKPLEQVAGHTEEDSLSYDEGHYDEETETLVDKVDYSVHWWCPKNQCYGKDYPLRQHDPFKGWESRPGDSWSLSWIK